jgi:lysophospholipase L1-like esterase
MRFLALAVLLASPARAASTITIVALGDSTTAGTPGFRSPLEAPPDGAGNPESQFSYWMMKKRPKWRVLNRGVNGERADEIRARFARDVEAEKPRVVIILAGVNDAYQGRPAEETEADLEWMYARASALGIAPVAATVLPFTRATEEQAFRIETLNAWIRRRAKAGGFALCDTAKAAADPNNPRALKASPDGLHPDPATYRAVGEALVRAIGSLKLKP